MTLLHNAPSAELHHSKKKSRSLLTVNEDIFSETKRRRKSFARSQGISLVELLLSLFIITIIASIMASTIRMALRTYNVTTDNLAAMSESSSSHAIFDNKLKNAVKITDVSLADNDKGYIQFLDTNALTVSVFYNSVGNQAYFNAENTISTRSIVAQFQNAATSTNAQLIFDNISQFTVTTFKESPGIQQLVSKNNLTAPVKTSEIHSLKLTVTQPQTPDPYTIDRFITLRRTPFEGTSTIVYGTNSSLFSPLAGNDFTHVKMATKTDSESETSDGAYVSNIGKFVKIQNTGLYYDTIQEAMDNATDGDAILIAGKGSSYTENLLVKSGITLKGGYHPETWERNPEKYPSIIETQSGLSILPGISATLIMKDRAVLDGLTIDGQHLKYGIYADNAKNIQVSNCHIYNAEQPLALIRSTGIIQNNEVTGNEHCLYIFDTDNIILRRNLFYSANQAQKSNIYIQDANTISLYNNLIINGYAGIESLNSFSIVLNNNIVTQVENFGLLFHNSTSVTLRNNGIFQNNLGAAFTFTSPPPNPNLSVKNNFFANNVQGDIFGVLLDSSNLQYTVSETLWKTNNPFFTDLTRYTLRNTDPSTTLVDKGFNTAVYNDRYTSQNPSQGTLINDIGLYGGPEAGRIGPGKMILIPSSNSQAAMNTAITNAFPGDWIQFGVGSFSLNTTIQLKPYQYLLGHSSIETLLLTDNIDPLIQTHIHTQMADIRLTGESNNTAILVDSATDTLINNVVIEQFQIGTQLNDATALIPFNTFVNNEIDIIVNGTSTITPNYNIFANSTTGIDNNTATPIAGVGNLFHNVFTESSGDYTGTFDVSELDTAPLFRPTSPYLLVPSANAINITQSYDAGSMEYFLHSGYLLTPTFNSTIKRYYNELEFVLGGQSTIPAGTTQLQIQLLTNQTPVTLNESIIVVSNAETTHTVSLPVQSIASAFQVKITFNQFRSFGSAFLNKLTLKWK